MYIEHTQDLDKRQPTKVRSVIPSLPNICLIRKEFAAEPVMSIGA